MLKHVRSWSKLDIPDMIARKKVDWSIFINGSHIPLEFREDFEEANNGLHISRGEKQNVKLIIGDTEFDATLVNVDRKEVSADSLQLRYDNNKDLKKLLGEAFGYSYQFINEYRKTNENKTVILPDEDAEYMEFYKTDKPFVYKVHLKTNQANPNQRNLVFWWVNQGQTYTQEKNGGYLWAPQKSKQGRALPHHVKLLEPKVGDIVFCYSSMEVKSVGVVKKTAVEAPKPLDIASHGWEEDGYIVELTYFDLQPVIKKDEIPIDWRLEEGGPFDVNGNLKQGYFFDLSEGFAKKLYKLFKDRFAEEVRLKMVEYQPNNAAAATREPPQNYYSNKQLVDHIYTYIKSKGFYYQKEEVINLYLSLKTKPFVILSGISGTGKTKMVQWFAESVGATEENGQFALIPIRPDWNDGSDLLGYRDIKGEFQKGPLTKVIERAFDNPELPYFVLLDEMNLARVEYYFSDILSVMESRKWEDGKIVSSNLLTKEHADIDIKLPNNLYIIGTVNMDETTHPLSKKVLDRANTIEFNRVELDYLEFLKDLAEVDPVVVGQKSFASDYLHLKDVYVKHPSLVERVTRELVEINKALQLINAHVGYRVRDEICFYLAYNEEGKFMKPDDAMDHCILQKVLPRIAGSDQRVETLLKQLFLLFAKEPIAEDLYQVKIDRDKAKYPHSAAKVLEMLRGLRDGFTSFWIS